MYCRNCEYDLRGQTEARCPECGERFDPGDESTYWFDPPTWSDRLLKIPEHLPAFVLTMVYFSAIGWGLLWIESRGPRSRPPMPRQPHHSVMFQNLRHVVSTWREASLACAPADRAKVTPRQLQGQLGRRLSPHQHEAQLASKHGLEQFLRWKALVAIAVFLIYTALLSLVTGGSTRRNALRALGLCGVAFIATWSITLSLGWVWPGDRKYIDDYAYVPVDDWNPPSSAEARIVAYQQVPIGGWSQHVIVGFNDGTVRVVYDEQLEELAVAQGFQPVCPASNP